MTNQLLNWGILGTGHIAGVFARGLSASTTGRLVAVGSRSAESAAKFAAAHGGITAHGSYEALLADPAINVVYVATPHPQHVEWTVRAAEAGKHILCEKPLGLNQAEAMVMFAAARIYRVALMEAYMYRCHPQTAKIVEIVRSGVLGTPGLIQAAFGFRSKYASTDATARIWSNAGAGGAILDVGGYPVSMARLIAGAVVGKPFADPVQVHGVAQFHTTGVDATAAATLKFGNGFLAEVSCGIGMMQDNVVRIYGTDAWLLVPTPWVVTKEGGTARMLLHKKGQPASEEIITESGPLYAGEADAFGAAVLAGRREVPQMTPEDTMGNMSVLDQWRSSAGLVYATEKPENFQHTHDRRPLRRATNPAMKYGRVARVDKPVSRLVMGCDNQRTMPHAAAMWDDYFTRGGNTFDTAFVYGAGAFEKMLGHWLKNRGVRHETVIIGKGGATPLCRPEHVTDQLRITLERLQTDHLDVYMLHRDNPDVPVGEFVDVLNEHVRSGRIKSFGGSNWTLPRLAAANRYATRKGLQGFEVLSNNFSLARMVDPVWAGCVAASDPVSRRWLRKTQVPLFAWSSQARGFFTDRAGRDKLGDKELVRCWYADDNFERRERARSLAEKRGVAAINIAAAYVLAQAFPTFALIGPRTLEETASSFACLGVELTPEEVGWLNLERAEPGKGRVRPTAAPSLGTPV